MQQVQIDSILVLEASSTIYPLISNEQEYEGFRRKTSGYSLLNDNFNEK